MFKHSIKTGLNFGLTSGTITTLGLIVGLGSGTHSKIAVVGGILMIAIADAASDALGIHLSEESENQHSAKEIWETTFFTFLSKFFFALTFLIPVLTLDLSLAITVSVIWGLLALGTLSFITAKNQKTKIWVAVSEHLTIALAVITITHYIGKFISSSFG